MHISSMFNTPGSSSSSNIPRTVTDVGQRGSYQAAVDYPLLQSLGKLACGTDLSWYGNIQELVIPTEIDACLLGLILVFLPGATIFNEDFRGKVDTFLQRSGLDKIQEGGGFFERLQEGFNRLQNGKIETSSIAPPNSGYNIHGLNDISDNNPTYSVQTINTNLALLNNNDNPLETNYQPLGTNYQSLGTNYQPPTTNHQTSGANYQHLETNYNIHQPLGTSYQPLGTNYPPLRTNFQPLGTNQQILATNYQPSGSSYEPLGTNYPLETNYQPSGTNYQEYQTLEANNQPLGTNYQPFEPNYQPQEANYQPFGTNYQPQGANYQPFGTDLPQDIPLGYEPLGTTPNGNKYLNTWQTKGTNQFPNHNSLPTGTRYQNPPYNHQPPKAVPEQVTGHYKLPGTSNQPPRNRYQPLQTNIQAPKLLKTKTPSLGGIYQDPQAIYQHPHPPHIPSYNPPPHQTTLDGYNSKQVPRQKTDKQKKYSITDILSTSIAAPMSLISGFMSKMKSVGAKLKVKKQNKPKAVLPAQVVVVPTAQPGDYLTNFEEINTIKDDLFDLAEISEKELLAYSRVQAMLAKLEEEQKKKEEEKKNIPPVAAIPAPLENPFDSISRRNDILMGSDRRYDDDSEENDDKKAYLVARLEESDLTDDELMGYLKVQTILHRIGRKVTT